MKHSQNQKSQGNPTFSIDILRFNDAEAEVNQIVEKLRYDLLSILRRKGAVVGISGGVDSSLTLALTVKAVGSENVVGIMLPDKDSSGESKVFAQKLAKRFDVQTIEENITDALAGFGCYIRRDEAVANVFPEYNPDTYTMKIGIDKSGLNRSLPPVFTITIINSEGTEKRKILPVKEYLQIVAASNFKQRSRMAMLYYHAEKLHYAVVGTPNKHEVEQGFFVKNGDGSADIMPISHLYKSQVYQLAEYIGVPNEILNRVPTSDTYPAEQTQEEFFFQLPYLEMDLIWYAIEHDINPQEVGKVLNKTTEEIKHIYNNLNRKKRTTEYLRMSPIVYK